MNRTIEASERSTRGKNEARRLRAGGRTPANLLGQGKSTAIDIDEREFGKMLAGGLRPSSKITLNLKGTGYEVLAKDILRHPVTGRVLHVDFYKTNPGHKFRVNIPIEITGFSKGVKAGGALEHYIRLVNVTTLPESVIEKIEVDVTDLGVGESVHLSQLKLPTEWNMKVQGDPVVCRVAESRVTTKQGDSKEG